MSSIEIMNSNFDKKVIITIFRLRRFVACIAVNITTIKFTNYLSFQSELQKITAPQFLFRLLGLNHFCYKSSFYLADFFNSQFRLRLQYLSFIIFIQHMEQPSEQQHFEILKGTQKLQTLDQHLIDIHSQKKEEVKSSQCFPQNSQLSQDSSFYSQHQKQQLDNGADGECKKLSKNKKESLKIKNKKDSEQQVEVIQELQKGKQNTGQYSQAILNADASIQKNQDEQISPKKIIERKPVTSRSKKSRSIYKFDKNDEDSLMQTYKFPFTNQYIQNHSEQFLSTEDAIEAAKKQKQSQNPNSQGTFLNCDVRYFNWELFIQEVGKFDVLVIDPPWRIKGAQQNDSQFMFSNCKFSLQYNTMGNSQIARIPLNLISDEGFIFLWILNSQLDTSIQIMQKWGYELVDEITWIKLRDEKIYLTHGYYFMHSYQICLIGYKNNKNPARNKSQQRLKIRGPLANNTMFAQVRKKSQKPEDLYAIIQMMFPGKRRVQVFARNHNLRFGIFSIGNELGESYEKWKVHLNCDKCSQLIQFGTKRYKSKLRQNYDLCHKCIEDQDQTHFFEISNQVDEDIRHEYVSCNHCGIEPIWGIRFQCVTCHDYDICENCYDQNISAQHKFHPIHHQYRLLEVPVFGNGFPIHEVKCFSCYQNPIIGVYFNCTFCKNYKLCQKCYFQRPKTDSNSRNHRPEHQMEVLFEPMVNCEKKYECFACKIQILQNCHMCQNCYNFFFCEKCYQKKDSFKSLYANNHKKYHVYTKIF